MCDYKRTFGHRDMIGVYIEGVMAKPLQGQTKLLQVGKDHN